jgi:hypothetical protein
VNTRVDTPAETPPDDECQRQLHKTLQSANFRSASMLQQLLRYLTDKSFARSSEVLKEYTIGVEALGRPLDFDPKADPIVRVQIHRLRQKLKEYFDSDGLQDGIVIEIPKGQHLPVFRYTFNANPDSRSETASENDWRMPKDQAVQNGQGVSEAKLRRLPKPLLTGALLAIAVLGAVFVAGLWMGNKWARAGIGKSGTSAKSDPKRSSDPVMAFWAKYIGNDPNPVIAYPDAMFLLDNYNDLFRFKRGATDYRGAPVDAHLAEQFASNPALVARAGPLYYENSYLGFGELQAVGMLSNLFGRMGYKPIIKPSREVTVDDLMQHNVIMLGSSSQNIAVAHFSNLGDFSFKDFDTRLEQWRGAIVNSHPHPNEATTYHTERDPNTRVLKADYSLITVQPGVAPGRYIADLGGLDTTGSEGAVLYATSTSGVEELSRAIQSGERSGDRGPFPVFQALLKVQLEKGYDVVGVSLISVHIVPPARLERKSEGNGQGSQP